VRKRITLLATLASILAVVLFAVPMAITVARYLVADERNELQRVAATTAATVSGDLSRNQPPPSPVSESGTQVTIYDAHGKRISGSGADIAAPLVQRALTGAADTGSVAVHLAAAAPVSDGDTITGAVLVTSNRSQVNSRVAVAWVAMLGLATIAVLATALIARIYSRRLTAPVRALAATADRMGGGDFTARAVTTGISDLDSLATAINLSAERIATMIERERAFSADASHQLRTPLTGLRLELEAALDDPEHDPRQSLTGALETVDRLEHTVATLLALARDVPKPMPLPIADIAAFIQDAWHARLAALNRPLRVLTDIEATLDVLCSRPAVEQILDVLLDNAARHGHGAVTVTLRESDTAVAIDVADQGPALTAEPQILFARRTTASDGHQIGLALARTLAEAEGGRLVLSRSEPPTFTLLLQEGPVRTPQDSHRPA
jgi:signal transduction histidine kinase